MNHLEGEQRCPDNQKPTGQQARRPDQTQAPHQRGEGTPATSFVKDRLDELRKERESLYQSPLGKILSKHVGPTEKPAGIFDCSWIMPSPEEVDRRLEEGIISEQRALELKKQSSRLREEIEFRANLTSMVDDGLITRQEYIQRVRQFLESRDSEK